MRGKAGEAALFIYSNLLIYFICVHLCVSAYFICNVSIYTSTYIFSHVTIFAYVLSEDVKDKVGVTDS